LISLNAGASWVRGDFFDPISRHAWRRWKYDWITPAQPGRCTLLARATGADQRAQPDGHNPNFGSYVIDHSLPSRSLWLRFELRHTPLEVNRGAGIAAVNRLLSGGITEISFWGR
jgi:hypothetical protein